VTVVTMSQFKKVQTPSIVTVSQTGDCIRDLEELKKTDEPNLVDVTVGTETKIFVQEE